MRIVIFNMNPILRSTVLNLLCPEQGAQTAEHGSKADHLRGDDDTNNPTTIRINETDYRILASTIDLRLQDAKTAIPVQAARVILTLRRLATTTETATGTATETETETEGVTGKLLAPHHNVVEVAAHAFAWLRDATSPANVRIEAILDTEAAALPGQHTSSHARPPTVAPRASLIPTHPPPTPPGPPSSSATARGGASQSLAVTYRAYIAAINARAMSTSLPHFCHATVTHNAVPHTLPEYQALMEDAQAAIPDITFVISDLITNEQTQMVAARLEFTGTPEKEFAGVCIPSSEKGRRREVRFSEVVFYWFQEGKIREVVSLVDLEAYRKQVKG